MSFLTRLGTRTWNSFCNYYCGLVAAELNVYGLKYDDVKIEQDPDYAVALTRLSPHEQMMRARRLKRAFDISFKEKTLPEELQKIQRPFDSYIVELQDQAKARRIERDLLNKYD